MRLTGTMTAKKIGVFTETTMMTLTKLKTMIIHNRNVRGRFVSIMSMSLENLFIIRPTGVVSKNDIGERRMHLNMD